MKRTLRPTSLLFCALATLTGCAGPATPLGAIWDLRPVSADRGRVDEREPEPDEDLVASRTGPRIHFDPPRQILHGSHPLRVIIDDPKGVRPDYDLHVSYRGYDVTRSFLMQARVSREERGSRLLIDVPAVRLSPLDEHLIEVRYANRGSGARTVSRYRPPVCRAFERQRALENFDEFRPEPELSSSIRTISRQMGFNPAFTAALIAQESAFNPQSVSGARAVGLTQVTPVAEEEISLVYPSFPRYPGLNDVSAPVLKWLVLNGEVNGHNEWRLNPERSIRGGLAFAQMLADRWQDSETFSKVSWTGGYEDAEVARTRLLLASYNSGYARVAQAINRYGQGWLGAPELHEARRYVNRIFSYCEAFSRADSAVLERAGGAGGAAVARLPAAQSAPIRPWPEVPTNFSPALIKKVMHENET